MIRECLFDEPNRQRITKELAVACLDGGNDDEDGVQHPEHDQDRDSDENEAKDDRGGVVDQHRELKVERLFAMGVDLGRIAAFEQPDDERPEDVAEEMKEESEQGTGVTKDTPGAGVG